MIVTFRVVSPNVSVGPGLSGVRVIIGVVGGLVVGAGGWSAPGRVGVGGRAGAGLVRLGGGAAPVRGSWFQVECLSWWQRSNASTSCWAQGQPVARRSRVRRPVRAMMPAVCKRV